MAETVLVVEGEGPVRDLLLTWLEDAGYDTRSGATGAEGLEELRVRRTDLVVADVVMPETDGFEFCRLARRASRASIMILSALDNEVQRVRGLDLGADDYLVKPVGRDEFLARVAALLRRRRWSEEGAAKELSYRDGEVTIRHERHEVLVRGVNVDLTPIEFKLMAVLTESAGNTCTIDEIRQRVWGSRHYSAGVVRWHIAALRRKIEADTTQPPRRIVTIRGVGYRYVVPAASPAEDGHP